MKSNYFGEILRDAREKKGMTQSFLAQELSVEHTAVSQWERGKTKPRNIKLKELSTILDIPLEELIAASIGESDVAVPLKEKHSEEASIPKKHKWLNDKRLVTNLALFAIMLAGIFLLSTMFFISGFNAIVHNHYRGLHRGLHMVGQHGFIRSRHNPDFNRERDNGEGGPRLVGPSAHPFNMGEHSTRPIAVFGVTITSGFLMLTFFSLTLTITYRACAFLLVRKGHIRKKSYNNDTFDEIAGQWFSAALLYGINMYSVLHISRTSALELPPGNPFGFYDYFVMALLILMTCIAIFGLSSFRKNIMRKYESTQDEEVF